jgi:hypothetical protein
MQVHVIWNWTGKQQEYLFLTMDVPDLFVRLYFPLTGLLWYKFFTQCKFMLYN